MQDERRLTMWMSRLAPANLKHVLLNTIEIPLPSLQRSKADLIFRCLTCTGELFATKLGAVVREMQMQDSTRVGSRVCETSRQRRLEAGV